MRQDSQHNRPLFPTITKVTHEVSTLWVAELVRGVLFLSQIAYRYVTPGLILFMKEMHCAMSLTGHTKCWLYRFGGSISNHCCLGTYQLVTGMCSLARGVDMFSVTFWKKILRMMTEISEELECRIQLIFHFCK